MKRNVSRVLFLFLALLVFMGSFAACGEKPAVDQQTASASAATLPAESSASESATSSAEPEKPAYLLDTTPITLDVYFNASWYAEQWITDINTRSTSYITKKTGVTLNLIAPTGNESEKMATMIASNEVPDIIMSDFIDANTTNLYKAGLLEPLNKLADQYDKSFYSVVKESQLGWFRRDDGNVYDYPNFASSYEAAMSAVDKPGGDTALGVRKDIYEAIGKPDMTTPDGFLLGLKLAQEKFPTVDGKPLIPIGLVFDPKGSRFFNAYVSQFLSIPVEKDGVLNVNPGNGEPSGALLDPEYVTWLKTFRKANEMGLIAKETYIDTRAQFDEKMLGGRYFVVTQGKSDIKDKNKQLFEANEDTGLYYIPLDAIRNAKGEDPKLNGKILLDGWMNAHITTQCKDKARAFRFLYYIMGPEGQHDAWYGEEGVTYTTIDGKDTINKELTDGTVPDEEVRKNFCVNGGNWTFYNSDIVRDFIVKPTEYEPIIDFDAYGAKYFYAAPQLSSISIDPTTDEGIAEANIDTLWGETLPQLLLAKSDEEFDQILSGYLAKRVELGYDKVMTARNAMYQANKQKLNIK